MPMAWLLIVLFLGDPAPKAPLFVPVPDQSACQTGQATIAKATKDGVKELPPHVSWCVPWPKDVPAMRSWA